MEIRNAGTAEALTNDDCEDCFDAERRYGAAAEKRAAALRRKKTRMRRRCAQRLRRRRRIQFGFGGKRYSPKA